MFKHIKPYWLTMSASKLQSHLRYHKYPADFIHNALAEYVEVKASRRATRIKQTVIYKQWHLILQPARTELGIVRTMKNVIKREEYLTEDLINKRKALDAYEEALVKIIAKLAAVQKQNELTPSKLVAQLREAGKQDIPNAGVHWTDYIPVATRRRVTALFDILPEPERGKKKVPFERRVSSEEHDKQRIQLVTTLNTEIEKAEQELEINPTMNSFDKDDLEKKLHDLYRAQFVLDGLKPTTPLPKTWHGLLTM